MLPLLLLLLVGMVEGGLTLSDQHAIETASREGARSLATGTTGGDTSCTVIGGTPNTATHELICLVKDRAGRPADDVRVKIVVPASDPEGEPGQVCVEYPSDSYTGLLTPLFGGELTSDTTMRIEVESTVTSFAETSHSGAWSC